MSSRYVFHHPAIHYIIFLQVPPIPCHVHNGDVVNGRCSGCVTFYTYQTGYHRLGYRVRQAGGVLLPAAQRAALQH